MNKGNKEKEITRVRRDERRKKTNGQARCDESRDKREEE